MIQRSSLDEIVLWIPWLCFLGPAYKAGQGQLGSRDWPWTNSRWLLRGDAVEAGDASVASASSTWVEGQFQANSHWSLEDAAGEVSAFSAWVVSSWVSWMNEMQGYDSLPLLLVPLATSMPWSLEVAGAGSGIQLRRFSQGWPVTIVIITF